jgi:hypothetical protein
MEPTSEQINELNLLSTLEDKCEFWKINIDASFFTSLPNDQTQFYLIDKIKNDAETEILLKYEIERLLIQNPEIELNEQRKKELKLLKKSNDISRTKSKLTEEFMDRNKTKFESMGYVAYNGLFENLEDICNALVSKIDFNDVEVREHIIELYNGYVQNVILGEILSFTPENEGQDYGQAVVATNYIAFIIVSLDLQHNRLLAQFSDTDKAKFFCRIFNLSEGQSENLRKAISNPKNKLSGPAIKFLKKIYNPLQINLKDTGLGPFLPT